MPFQPTWESLSQYQCPEWYKDAKLGIFIHWGVYFVPDYGNEWYLRQMYADTTCKVPESIYYLKNMDIPINFSFKNKHSLLMNVFRLMKQFLTRNSEVAIILLIVCSISPEIASCQLVVPKLFSDGMVFQRKAPIVVWGKGTPNSNLTVSFHQQQTEVGVDASGHWKTFLNQEQAGGPYTLKVKSTEGDSLVISDVLVGDVWICAGQSNMNFILRADEKYPTEINNLNFPEIRQFRCAMPPGVLNPENANHSAWLKAIGHEADNFSAVAYYFSKELHLHEKVPIGIITMACGDTRAETWIDRDYLEKDQQFQPHLNYWEQQKLAGNTYLNHMPGAFYSEVVKNVAPFNCKGVVWYQGESNTLPDQSTRTISDRAAEYPSLLKALITNWRTAWNYSKMPFVIIQLPNYVHETGNLHWSEIRQAQLDVTQKVRNCHLVVTIDSGDSTNIHPTRKWIVGERAANSAIKNCYKHGVVNGCGPIVRSVKLKGNQLKLVFDKPIFPIAPNTTGLVGFSLADSKSQEIPVEAHLKNGTVCIQIPPQVNATTLKYAWGDNPQISIADKFGVPASPFQIIIND